MSSVHDIEVTKNGRYKASNCSCNTNVSSLARHKLGPQLLGYAMLGTTAQIGKYQFLETNKIPIM